MTPHFRKTGRFPMTKPRTDRGLRCGCRPMPLTAASVFLLLLAMALAGGCQKDETPTKPTDTVRPARVTDLRGLAIGTSAIRLAWTAVGGDSLTGVAARYALRVTTNPADSWDEMEPISGLPTPGEPGSRDSVIVDGLDRDVTFRFLLRAYDSQGNASALSNPSVVTTLRTDDDLRWWPSFAPPPNGQGVEGSVLALGRFGDDLIAGGDFEQAGGVRASHIARWDGAAWGPLGAGLNGPVLALAEYDGHLYVGGSFTQSGTGRAMYLASWDGSAWSASRSEPDGSVAALAVHGGNLIVAGGFTHVGNVEANHVAAWNGSSWSALGGGTDDWITSVAVWNDELIVGGYFRHAGGDSAVYVARWDGTSWHPLGVGEAEADSAAAGVTVLAVHDGLLYAGGTFDRIGGSTALYLASWNGLAWEQAGGIDGGSLTVPGVFALGSFGTDLVAAGRFMNANGCAAGSITIVDPSRCGALGSGIGRQEYRIVLALTEWNGSLYAGGTFQIAGNRPSAGIARWLGE